MVDGEEREKGAEGDEVVEDEGDERGGAKRSNKRMKTSIDDYTKKGQYSSNQNTILLPLPCSLPFLLPSPVSTHTPSSSSTHTPIPPLPSLPHEDAADRFRGIVFFDGLGDIVDVQAPLLKFQVTILMISFVILIILLPALDLNLILLHSILYYFFPFSSL